MKTSIVLLLLAALPAYANPKAPPLEQNQGQLQGQIQGQKQGQLQGQNQTAQSQSASNAVAEANAYSASAADAVSDAASASSADNAISTRAIAIGTTAPIPAQAVDCYLPKRKFGRGFAMLWGAVQFSAVLERDEACIADLQDERAYRLAALRLEAERDRAAVERMRVEREWTRDQAK